MFHLQFDEVVPTHLETKHRGFYINSGELDFETVPEASSEEDTASHESEIRRKRPVSYKGMKLFKVNACSSGWD